MHGYFLVTSNISSSASDRLSLSTYEQSVPYLACAYHCCSLCLAGLRFEYDPVRPVCHYASVGFLGMRQAI